MFRFRINPLIREPDSYMSFIGMPAAARAVVAVRPVNPSAGLLARSQRISNRRFVEATGWRADHAGAEGLAESIAATR